MVSCLPSPLTAREGDHFLERRGSWEWEGYNESLPGKKRSLSSTGWALMSQCVRTSPSDFSALFK